MQRIIYPNDDGGVSIVCPSPSTRYTMEELAIKDVPTGLPYRIINAVDIPTDRTFRDAWEADFTEPDRYGG